MADNLIALAKQAASAYLAAKDPRSDADVMQTELALLEEVATFLQPLANTLKPGGALDRAIGLPLGFDAYDGPRHTGSGRVRFAVVVGGWIELEKSREKGSEYEGLDHPSLPNRDAARDALIAVQEPTLLIEGLERSIARLDATCVESLAHARAILTASRDERAKRTK